jgi:hypothetical protein
MPEGHEHLWGQILHSVARSVCFGKYNYLHSVVCRYTLRAYCVHVFEMIKALSFPSAEPILAFYSDRYHSSAIEIEAL